MGAVVLDGNIVASEIIKNTAADIAHLTVMSRTPRLVAIRANNDKGSEFYARMQDRFCSENGVDYILEDLGHDASAMDVSSRILHHNENPETSAIMLHMPLPVGVNAREMSKLINPLKDAEGMHPRNLGRLVFETDPVPSPCTAAGALRLVMEAVPELAGLHCVVVGHSRIVGRPLALMLLGHDATVSVANVFTPDLESFTLSADVLVVATGAAGHRYNAYKAARKRWESGEGGKPTPCDLSYLVKKEMVKPGATVVDIGVNRIPEGFDAAGDPLVDADTGRTRLVTVGDVDFAGVSEVAGFITSPKGGSGPVTNAMLLRNTVHCAKAMGENR